MSGFLSGMKKAAKNAWRLSQPIMSPVLHQELKAYLNGITLDGQPPTGNMKILLDQAISFLDAYAKQTPGSLAITWLSVTRSDVRRRLSDIIATAYKLELDLRGVSYNIKDEENIRALAERIVDLGPKIFDSFNNYVKEQRATTTAAAEASDAATQHKKSKASFLKGYVQNKFKDKSKQVDSTISKAAAEKNSEDILMSDIILRLTHDGLLPEKLTERDPKILALLLSVRLLSLEKKVGFAKFVEKMLPGDYEQINDLDKKQSKEQAKKHLGQYAKNIYRAKPALTTLKMVQYNLKIIPSVIQAGVEKLCTDGDIKVLERTYEINRSTNSKFENLFVEFLGENMSIISQFGTNGPMIDRLLIDRIILATQDISPANAKLQEIVKECLADKLSSTLYMQALDAYKVAPDAGKIPDQPQLMKLALVKVVEQITIGLAYTNTPTERGNFIEKLKNFMDNNRDLYSEIYSELKNKESDPNIVMATHENAALKFLENAIKDGNFTPVQVQTATHNRPPSPGQHI